MARLPAPALIHVLFFLSGIAALVYEVSWSRLVGLAIGNTAQAAALVLASYFTGLAVGQFFGGLRAIRGHGLFGYGVAEILAAGWACFIPMLLTWVRSPVGQNESALFRDSSFGLAVWCFLVLLPATIPLGATLPLVMECLAASSASKRHASLAYALNTAGGVVGIVAALACLLIFVGVRASGFLAAGLAAACGLTAVVTAFLRPGTRSNTKTAVVAIGRTASTWAWTAVAAISGFGTLGLEVLYTRMFSLVFHNSSYTFGAVVAVFLLALSIGAMLTSWFGSRFSLRRIAATSFSLGGLAVAVSVIVFRQLTGLDYFVFGDTFAGYLLGSFGLVALIVLPPVVLLGTAFPAALQAAADCAAVGRVASVNTLAGAAGALASAFLLPSRIGLWPTFGLFVAFFSIAGVVSLGRRHRNVAVTLAVAGVAAVSFVVTGPMLAREDAAEVQLVRRWESAYGWVDVVESPASGSRAVRQNLHYRYGSTGNAVRQYREGRLPLLLHPRPAEVAFLGLGTGLTAAPATADRDVERAVIVELIPEVVEASRLLASSNLGVVDDPKVDVQINDARQYLLHTNRQFDVIVADLFVPWESRAGYLYTVEFYETARQRLKHRGLYCQWLALYQVGPQEFELIADTLASVFPQTTLWWADLDAERPIIALVGSERPLVVETEQLEGRMGKQGGLSGVDDVALRIPAELSGFYLGDWTRNSARKLNTDEHPWLEFTAPVSHRSRRTLHGPALQTYFDRVFADLPSSGVRFGREFDSSVRDSERRRARQRFSLFGDVTPSASKK